MLGCLDVNESIDARNSEASILRVLEVLKHVMVERKLLIVVDCIWVGIDQVFQSLLHLSRSAIL